MSKKTILILLATAILIIVGAFLITRNQNAVADSALPEINPEEVQVSPESYDIGKVIMKAGTVTREYQIKNGSQNTLRLKNIVTSCMCTRAQVSLGDRRTRFYAMEMSGAKNPDVDFDIPGGETATVTVRFDPAAHGVAGVGPVDRSVYLTFLDPVGKKEVKFSGEVALQ